MRSGSRAALVAVSALLAMSSIAPASAASGGKTTRWVDDDGKAGPTNCGGSKQASTSIQGAIDKSDKNDLVIVCPGKYTGTIGITGARDGLTVRGYSSGTAVLRVPKSHDADSVVWVEGVSNVTLQWLTVAFPSTGCAPHVNDVNGLFAEDADGLHIVANQFRTAGSATQGPCGYTDGIRVLSSSRVVVRNNVVRDFQSDGISFEAGSRGLIKNNAVHFYHGKAGSDDDGDQGIRIVDGSRAEVTQNVVRSYPGPNKPHTEIGIALQNAGGTSEIHHNKVWYTKIGVDAIDSTIRLRSNDIHGVGTDGGIYIESGTGSQVLRNRVQNFEIGIEVDVSGTTIRSNDLRGNVSDGCIDTTSGSGTAGTGNTWSGNIATPASSPASICSAP
jgi:parallel beta-helix repeat protein